MPDQITEYIKTSLERGFTLEQVKQALLQGGYPEQNIDQAIAAFQQGILATAPIPGQQRPLDRPGSPPPKVKEPTPEEVKDEPYFIRLTSILFHPLKHLDKYKDEKGIGTPFKFMFFTTAISILVTALFSIMSKGELGATMLEVIKSFFFYPALNFISAGMLHIWMKVVGSKEGFYQTFKAIVYPGALFVPGSFFLGLMFFSNLAWIGYVILAIWNLVLIESCLKAYTGIGTGKLIVALILFIISIFALSFVLTMLAMIVGFSLYATGAIG
ncbi:TPA: YIP1 family protein [Candidatus Woesearchaeota archaeon]|nr:YIP1 family protein [Candidatus Woesearchaeota archaeon]